MAQIRRINLARICKRFESQTQFAAMIGMSQSQLNQLLVGHRNVGERLARKIEKQIGLKENDLDRDPSGKQADLIAEFCDAIPFVDIPVLSLNDFSVDYAAEKTRKHKRVGIKQELVAGKQIEKLFFVKVDSIPGRIGPQLLAFERRNTWQDDDVLIVSFGGGRRSLMRYCRYGDIARFEPFLPGRMAVDITNDLKFSVHAVCLFAMPDQEPYKP